MTLPIIWLVIAVFFLVVEFMTAALVSIWFIPSALITAVVAIFWDSIAAQIILFIVLSAVFLFVFHKFYSGKLKKQADDVDVNSRLIGKSAKVTEDIDADGGKVLIGDIYWRAVTDDGVINSGETVKISSVNGTTLVVDRK